MSIKLEDALVELIRRCAVELPGDVTAALIAAKDREKTGSMAYDTFDAILKNVEVAKKMNAPMCQDTGVPIFWVSYDGTYRQQELSACIMTAVREATKRNYMRPNSVDSLTGKNPGDNTGIGFPVMHFDQWVEKTGLRVEALLKGGGSENVSIQYALPNTELGAGRDLDGVRKVVLDAVFRAQGKGCAPGVLGVSLGAHRDLGYEAAKHSLMRKLDDKNPVSELAKFEARLLKDLNELGIGPMGLGGKTTVLGVKVTALHRHPASFIVSVAYNCWALRRYTMNIKGGRVRYD